MHIYKVSSESTLSILKTVLSPLDFGHICSSIEAKTAKIKDRLSPVKLERDVEKMVLARGLRFCLPPKAVDSTGVKCSFELLYRDLINLGHSLTSEDQDRLKRQLKNVSYIVTFTLTIIQSKKEF